MDADKLAEQEAYFSSALKGAATELQVQLIYQKEISSRDYSSSIETLDLACRALYDEGRRILNQIEECTEFVEIPEFNRYDIESEEIFVNEGETEWIEMHDPGSAEAALESHEKNIHKSSAGLEGRVTGRRLRNIMEEYEKLRERAREQDIHRFSFMENRMIDQEDNNEVLVEGEDAEILE